MSDLAKKLTVSFGAFSCTLSGFDDPFPVMRQVVDYFQQLAQRDPHFGAHPERPDTEALRALAEASSGTSVDAEMNGDEIVLQSKTAPAAATAFVVPDVMVDNIETELFDAPQEFEDDIELFDEIAAEDIDYAGLNARFDTDLGADSTDEGDEPAGNFASFEDDDTPEAHPDAPAAPAAVFDSAENDLGPDDIAPDDVSRETAQTDLTDTAELGAILAAAIEATDTDEDDALEQVDAAPLELAEEAKVYDPAPADGYVDASDLANTVPTAFEPVDPTAEDLTAEIHDDTKVDLQSTLPTWASELVSDTPVPEKSFEADDLSDDHSDLTEATLEGHSFDDADRSEIDAEDAALERVLQATEAHTPAQDTGAGNAPVSAGDTVGAETGTPDENGHYHDATSRFDRPEMNNHDNPIRLGFGDTGGLDATRDVASATEDLRPAPLESDLNKLGVFEDDGGDFNWDEAVADAVPEDAGDKPAPLLLTPQYQVAGDGAPVAQDKPAAMIDLAQDDPREDLRKFAQSAGAVSLPEIMEASAAFVTLVNGRPNFTRNEILTMLDEIGPEDSYSQEARIKSFGQLLRGGRIQRLEEGGYEMSDDALATYEDRKAC